MWLGRKMTIFRKAPARALWISGNEPRKTPAALDFRLVSAPWHRVEQKQNKPSWNGLMDGEERWILRPRAK